MERRALRSSELLAPLLFAFITVVTLATRSEAQSPFDAMGVDRPVELLQAPHLTFVSIDGHERRLRDLRGRVVLLSFFTTS